MKNTLVIKDFKNENKKNYINLKVLQHLVVIKEKWYRQI